MKNQKGFTLIELIVVIVILGILAAFAIPKYMALDKEARISTIKYLGGSVKSAATLVHAIAKAQIAMGTGSAPSITIDSGSVVVVNSTTLYPTAANNGIISALEDITTTGYQVTTDNNSILIQKTGATTLSTCQVNYTETNAVPTIEVSTAGC